MKLNKNFNLEDALRDALYKECDGRALDNEDDFEATMEVISRVVKAWLVNRCEGCK